MVHLTTALDAASGVPLYEQLYRSLAAEMRTGAISAGTRMPGKRRLAAELSVSVNTVDAAYQYWRRRAIWRRGSAAAFMYRNIWPCPSGQSPPRRPSPRQRQRRSSPSATTSPPGA